MKRAERIEVQFLRPEEIIEAREKTSLIYLPLAPLEWHGPHLPMGVDPLRAHLAAVALARATGGVVMPPLYIGTERERSASMLRSIGFRGDEYVVGMDFPANPLPSLYLKEEVFALVLRNYLELLIDQWRFRNVVIVNGHGAENQGEVIGRLRAEFMATRRARVIVVMPMEDYPDHGWSHATREETETLMAYYPDSVDLGRLPEKPAPLKNLEWAIVDDPSFRGTSDGSFSVRPEEDPREAEAAVGRRRFLRTVAQLRQIIERELKP